MMRIKVKVHANSSQEKILKLSDKEFEIWIKEKPISGKANFVLGKIIRDHFGKKCVIVSGFTSRIKFVEVYD